MTAIVPTTLDVFRSSWADVRFLMLEESSVLFKIKYLLLFSIDSSIVWFSYLQTQTHDMLFIIICVVSLVVTDFKDDVMVVDPLTVVGCFIVVECSSVVWCTIVKRCSTVVRCACAKVVVIVVVLTGGHDTLLVGIILLTK